MNTRDREIGESGLSLAYVRYHNATYRALLNFELEFFAGFLFISNIIKAM
jgi:hypothetical protein